MPVREHVTRRHLRTTVDCTRCFKRFESEHELMNTCGVRQDAKSLRRALSKTECTLPRRSNGNKKRKKNVTGEEKWLDLYRIIFPDLSVGNQPLNPCESISIPSANPDRKLTVDVKTTSLLGMSLSRRSFSIAFARC